MSTHEAEELVLTGALSSIIQRSANEAQIEALKTQLQEVEQEAMMRTHQGERRLRAEFVEEFQSFENHHARLVTAVMGAMPMPRQKSQSFKGISKLTTSTWCSKCGRQET